MFFSAFRSAARRPNDRKPPLPLAGCRVAAGFPSPADDFTDGALDLNDLVRHPAASFVVRVAGESMAGVGIHDGDLLIVDRSLEARPNHIVVAAVGGEMTVKRLEKRQGVWWLIPANPAFRATVLPPDGEIWGVVTYTIKRHV